MKLEFDLAHGLTVKDAVHNAVHKHVVLRTPLAGDVIDAQEESEKLVYAVQDGKLAPVLVTSPALIGMHVLRRQIVRLGELHGPLDAAVLKKLSLEDLALLQAKAQEIDQALDAQARGAEREVPQRGRDDGGGGGA